MYETVSPNRYDYAEQYRILNEKPDIVIAPVKTILEKFPDENFYKNNSTILKVGDEIEFKYKQYEIKEKIVGLVNTPDHIYTVKDESALFPTHKD